jgi:type I restriction enzyme S subunit
MGSGISSTPAQAGHGSPFVSFSTVFNNYFLPDNLDSLMDTSEQEQEVYSVKEGDIFLTRTSETIDELAMSSVSLKDYPKATFSGFVKRLRPLQKDITYHKYMGFYLRSKFFRKTITNNATMTLRASLNEEIFSYLHLYLPDYETQKRVGDLLFLIHTKIELNNRINIELEAMVQTLYDYWFMQFDFPDRNGNPYKSSGGRMVWNDELKREIPDRWNLVTVGSLIAKEGATKKIPSSEVLPNGLIPVIDQSTEFITGFTNDVTSIITTNEPRIIFGDHTRILKLINFDFARGADGTQIILSNSTKMPQHLLFHSLLKIDLSSYGYARHFKFLKEAKIILPAEDIAKRFELIAKRNYEKIKHNILENQQLTELRDWLLPMLMNGQVTVNKRETKMSSPTNDKGLAPLEYSHPLSSM